MEMNDKRVENNGHGGVQLLNGRIALQEITNAAARDRRKPWLVKRVHANQVKCAKRGIDNEGVGANTKRSKESLKCNVVKQNSKDNKANCTKNKSAESDSLIPKIQAVEELSGLSTQKYKEFTAKCRVSVDKENETGDLESTTSSEGIKKRSSADNTVLSETNKVSDILTQYEEEVYKYLLQLERDQLLTPNHLKDMKITSKMRQVIIDWLYEVQNHFRLCQETIELTVAVLDRCLTQDSSINQDNVQLVCLTAMFIAIKYEETFLLELSDLKYICDYSYQESDIIEMERKVLRILDFKISFISRTNFTGFYLRKVQKNCTVEKLVKYYVDLSLTEYELASVEPSRVASACVYIALCVSYGTVQQSLKNISSYTILDLRRVIITLATRALVYIGMEKGGAYNKHLRDTRPGSLREIVTSEIYSHTLKQICVLMQ